MKIRSIVTGGAGFIGSNLVDKLIDAGHHVIVIDNESAELNTKFYWNDKAENYILDICDYDSVRNLFDGVDFVFHLAAEARLHTSIDNPLNCFHANLMGTATALECSRQAGVKRFIYSSTSSGYGMNTGPNVETQTDDCLNPYSTSKVAAEKMCSLYTKLYNLNTIIFRYFNVYGERSPIGGQYAPVSGIFLKQYSEGKPLTIVGDGLQRRDFIHVYDIAKANIKFAEAELPQSAFGQVYNVASGSNMSVLELAKAISNDYVFLEKRLGEAKETLGDITKIQKTVDWKPEIDIISWTKDAKTKIDIEEKDTMDAKVFNRSN